MGQVWAAIDEQLHRSVALKLLDSSKRADARRLFREAHAARRVRHPNVIAIFDVVKIDGDMPILVTELLEGETLAARMARGSVPLDEATRILACVVSAVGTAHARGIVHRDLKPANIFLAEDDTSQPPTVKVLDFGIAKLERLPSGHTLTTTGTTMGTPAYMAPEQCRTQVDVDHRADIWAIGVLSYELIAGRRPLAGGTIAEITEQLVLEGVPPLRALAPDAPFQLAIIARKMLERKPSARPDDLREVAEVLEPLATGVAPSFGAPGSAVDDDADELPEEPPSSAEPLSLPRSADARRWLAVSVGAVAVVLLGWWSATDGESRQVEMQLPSIAVTPAMTSATAAPTINATAEPSAASSSATKPTIQRPPAPRPRPAPVATVAATSAPATKPSSSSRVLPWRE